MITEVLRTQSTEHLAQSIVELVGAQFCTGSDTLGPDGWRIVAGTCRLLGDAFTAAAEHIAAEGLAPEETDLSGRPWTAA